MRLFKLVLLLVTVGNDATLAAVLDRLAHVKVRHTFGLLLLYHTHSHDAFTKVVHFHALTRARAVVPLKLLGRLVLISTEEIDVILRFFYVIFAVDFALKVVILLLDLLLVRVVAGARLTTQVHDFV